MCLWRNCSVDHDTTAFEKSYKGVNFFITQWGHQGPCQCLWLGTFYTSIFQIHNHKLNPQCQCESEIDHFLQLCYFSFSFEKLTCTCFGISEAMWQMSLRPSETMESGPYPEHPGEPDCSYYIRTGLCRFGATCRFNHPPNRKLVRTMHFIWTNCIYKFIMNVFGIIDTWTKFFVCIFVRSHTQPYYH